MLKYLSKFAMEILPSVIATIIGAYIVNHYIVDKPATDASAIATPADAKKAVTNKAETNKAEAKHDAKPSEPSTVAGNLPEPGVKAKGISEKAMLEQTAAERPTIVEKPVEKSSDRPVETASIPVEARRHQPAVREKAFAKPAAAAPSTPVAVAAPVAAVPNAVPSAEVAPEEHRDANELARAAIERLRGAGEGSPRAQEAGRIADAPRVAPPPAGPVASVPAVQPLPPPIVVATPPTDAADSVVGSSLASSQRPAYPTAGSGDPRRPTPPADIPDTAPAQRPLDLQAEAVEPQRKERTNVAEEMLLAAKSVFQAVLPR